MPDVAPVLETVGLLIPPSVHPLYTFVAHVLIAPPDNISIRLIELPVIIDADNKADKSRTPSSELIYFLNLSIAPFKPFLGSYVL